MGKKPAEIENEIRAHRDRISGRIDELQRRVQDDLASVRHEAKGRASSAVGDTKGALKVDSLNDSLRSMLEEHTFSSLAGALGVGVALGFISESVPLGGNGGGKQRFQESRFEEREGRSAMSGVLATLLGPAANTAQDELRDLVREGFSTLREQVSEVRAGTRSSMQQHAEEQREEEPAPPYE